MRLSEKQDALLRRFVTAVEANAFADGFAILSEFRPHLSPALIPALLPALVPRGLRAAQTSPHRHAWADDMPERESEFRDELVRTLGACLVAAQAKDLAQLDAQCRNYGQRWRFNHWRWLLVPEFVRVLPAARDLRFIALALGTFHGSGYVRETAVQLLSETNDGSELPFLLLRLNDWVAQVQAHALKAVQSRLKESYVPRFARWLVLLHRLDQAQRNRLQDVVGWATALLTSPAGLPSLVAQYDAGDRDLRRAALQVSIERLGAGDRERALTRALADPDAGIRISAARRACDEGTHLETLDQDPCAVVRVWALRTRIEKEGPRSIPFIRRALYDRAASVRGAARFHAQRLDPSYSIVDAYRKALDTEPNPRVLSAVIAGLGEVGNVDDAALVAFHIESASCNVAKAAIRTCAKLARSECLEDLLKALLDARVGVSRAAQHALVGAPLTLDRLVRLLREAEHAHVRTGVVALMAGLPRWERLVGLLNAAASQEARVHEAALESLRRWTRRSDGESYLPTRPHPDSVSAAWKLLGNLDDETLRESIKQQLEAT